MSSEDFRHGFDSLLTALARQVPSPSGCRCHQPLLLGSPEPPQLEQVLRAGDQVPFAVNPLQSSQQEAPQAPGFLDLTVHQFHDRLALGIDR